MKLDIEKICKKRKWTGKEVGLILMANTLNDIKNSGRTYEPLVSQEFFTKMEKTLRTEKEYQAYSIYRTLYSAILDSYNTGLELYQQFYNSHSRLENILNEIIKVEKSRAILLKSPLFVTQLQYDDLKEIALENLSEEQIQALSVEDMEKSMLNVAINNIKEDSLHKDISFSGLAIIHTNDTSLLNSHGYVSYQDPLQYFLSIHTVSQDSTIKNNIHSWQHGLLYHALAYFYAFNTMLPIIEEVYEIENISSIAYLDTSSLEIDIEMYNAKLASLRQNLCGTDAEQNQKRAQLDEIFTPLDIISLQPTQDDIDSVRQTLKKLGFSSTAMVVLQNFDDFFLLLSKGIV